MFVWRDKSIFSKAVKFEICGGYLNANNKNSVTGDISKFSCNFTIIITKKKLKSHDQKENHKEDNYMSEGMAIGMCLGTVIGISMGKENLAIGMSVGMLLGIVIGMNCKK